MLSMGKIGIWTLLLVVGHALRAVTALAAADPGQWDPDYRYKMRLEVTNNHTEVLSAGYVVSVVLDHAALVAQGRSSAAGADVRIVRWDGGTGHEINRAPDLSAGWNRSTTRIWFRTEADIPPGGRDGSYYLYYGNPLAPLPEYESGYVTVPRKTLRSRLQQAVNKVLADNHTVFEDGTDYWRAAPGYVFAFAADTWYAFTGYPDYFTSAQIKNFFTKIIAARDEKGDFPIALERDGSAFVYYSAWDTIGRHVTGDGVFFTPMMEKLYYDKSGDITAFRETASYLKTALSHIPRDLYTKLVTVDPAEKWVPWGFQDAVRKTGNELMGSLLYYQASRDMADLYAVAGDVENAAFFTNEANDIRNNISLLWDESTGMFFGATGEGHQIDIEGSAYALYIGITTPAQRLAISNYLVRNFDTLTLHGYIRQSPEDWQYSYYIGNPDIPGCFGPGQYDNGRWSVANEWVATALKVTSPEKAVQYITDYSTSPDPTLEYLGIESWNGFSSNLESPMGAWKFYNDHQGLFPTEPSVEQIPGGDFSNVFTFWDNFSFRKPGWSSVVGSWSLVDGVMECDLNESSGDTKLTYDVGVQDNVLLQADFLVAHFNWADYSTVGVCLNSVDTGTVSARGYCSALRATDVSHSYILDEQVVWGGGTPFTWGTEAWYRTKIARVGNTLYKKIWVVGGDEPAEWQETYEQTDGSTATNISLLTSNSRSRFDNLVVRPYVLREPTVTAMLLPPDTTLSTLPVPLAGSPSATFAFSSSEPTATFECRLDSGAFLPCASPATYTDLSEGGHTFAVRARDEAGVADPSPETCQWSVDTTAPDTSITDQPPLHVTAPGMLFAFSSSESAVTFECRLNRPQEEFAPCPNPYRPPALANGSHTLSVRARDGAGNYDGTPASYTFTVNIPGGNVKMGGNHYGSVRAALEAASDGAVLMLRSMELPEEITFNRPGSFTVKGGYDPSFAFSTGTTSIRGSIAITDGNVAVDSLLIL